MNSNDDNCSQCQVECSELELKQFFFSISCPFFLKNENKRTVPPKIGTLPVCHKGNVHYTHKKVQIYVQIHKNKTALCQARPKMEKKS